jgi:hypothetical protein
LSFDFYKAILEGKLFRYGLKIGKIKEVHRN